MKEHINSAIKWLTKSGVRNNDKTKLSFGGINNGYDCSIKEHPFVYSEITGYAISTFLNIYKWTERGEYLQYAEDAAKYLLRIQCLEKTKEEYGAIPHSLTLPQLKIAKKYWSFDNAVVLQGLANLYTITKDEQLYEACIKIGGWLVNHMQSEDGSFLSMYDAEKGIKNHEWWEFHGDNGCLHIKNAIGLLKLSEITKDTKYENAAKKVCNWGMKLQDKDGIFWANLKKKYVFTHAHCYVNEGYLYAYLILKDSKYLEICKKSGEGLTKLQNNDGSLYRIYKNRISIWRATRERIYPWKATDATAQAVRIWLILYKITNDEKYLNGAQKGISFLKGMQYLTPKDDNMIGGFYYQCNDSFRMRKVSSNMFTWCTQFSINAFYAFENLEWLTADELLKEVF